MPAAEKSRSERAADDQNLRMLKENGCKYGFPTSEKYGMIQVNHYVRKGRYRMNEVLKVLKERRSIRKYKPEQIKDSELELILEAGTWAPTGMGKQSPIMVVVQDAETIAYLSKWNGEIKGTPDKDLFYAAPTVVVVLADGENYNWVKDGSLVMGNLMLAAHSLGVGSCWINRCQEFFDMPEGKTLLKKWGVEETYRGVGFCILGYADGPAPAPKPRKEDYIRRV